MNWLYTNIVSTLLLPPLNLLLLMLLGLLLLKRQRGLALALCWASIITLGILSTPWVGKHLLQTLEEVPPVAATQAEAIVVLGAGRYANAPEYAGHDTISHGGLERVRYAAHLARQSGTPILTSGGNPGGSAISEGELMKTSLEQDFNTPVKWVENHSDNTADEARECWRILSSHKIRRIYLVTHAWHMPRAAAAFRKVGFDVVPAPTGYSTLTPITALTFLPSAGGLANSSQALHEWIGLLWYRLKGAA
jgi:uncharacterized SAM-binding protein YcdF (DUF218 family)